jgi:hypothetical protein
VSGVVFFGKTKDGTAEACNQVVQDRFKNIGIRYIKQYLKLQNMLHFCFGGCDTRGEQN